MKAPALSSGTTSIPCRPIRSLSLSHSSTTHRPQWDSVRRYVCCTHEKRRCSSRHTHVVVTQFPVHCWTEYLLAATVWLRWDSGLLYVVEVGGFYRYPAVKPPIPVPSLPRLTTPVRVPHPTPYAESHPAYSHCTTVSQRRTARWVFADPTNSLSGNSTIGGVSTRSSVLTSSRLNVFLIAHSGYERIDTSAPAES